MALRMNVFLLWRTLAFVRVCARLSCGIAFTRTDKIAGLRTQLFLERLLVERHDSNVRRF